MENQMQKKTNNEMDTGALRGPIRGCSVGA